MYITHFSDLMQGLSLVCGAVTLSLYIVLYIELLKVKYSKLCAKNVIKDNIPYFPAHKMNHDFLLEILEKKNECFFNFSNFLEENRVVTYQN